MSSEDGPFGHKGLDRMDRELRSGVDEDTQFRFEDLSEEDQRLLKNAGKVVLGALAAGGTIFLLKKALDSVMGLFENGFWRDSSSRRGPDQHVIIPPRAPGE